MKATASPPYFPYREHRNMAQVMADEAAQTKRPYRKTPPAFAHCWGCVSRNVCAWPNECPRAAEMAQ